MQCPIYTLANQSYNTILYKENTPGGTKVNIKGFKFAGIRAGIKSKNLKDLALVVADTPATAAALFTRNRVKAAPVLLGQKVMENSRLQAVLVNSGNANCFTGEQGMSDARQCTDLTARELGIDPDLVLVSSTGMIGAPLPMDKFESGIPKACTRLSQDGLKDFSRAIMTTDTFEKTVHKTCIIPGPQGDVEIAMIGVAKGSGMIRPDMATMLAYVFTDAQISPDLLKQALTRANEKSFNRITVDGDTSTNDTVVCMASGASGAVIAKDKGQAQFQTLLDEVCLALARHIVKDGEGATKLVSIEVRGAATRKDAFKAAEAIAHSNLVKTAVYGQDPNWGRIAAAVGRSGAMVDQDKMDLRFGAIPLVVQGRWQGQHAEKEAAAYMKGDEIQMVLDLNLKDFSDQFLFCDFSENYVKINADYRS